MNKRGAVAAKTAVLKRRTFTREFKLQVREFDPRTPIIFLSGAAYQTDKDQAIAAASQAYITKPAAVEDVITAIRGAILNLKVNDS